jgi:glyoxylase-like metal-dependent hydrolase (beta-lactamase superfamily II)
MPTSLPVAAQWFTRASLPDGITLLSEPHVDAFARCNIWHVRGRERDLMIDTGLGLRSLREAALDLFERSLTAVLTHSHFDHVGGAHEFAERVAHEHELDALASPDGFGGLTASALGDDMVRRLRSAGYPIPEELLTAVPHAGFALDDFAIRSAPLTATVRDGDMLDLGDRVFEVLHVPGHSPGSIALWERKSGVLFSGDAIYDGPLLYDLPGSSLHDYARTLRRLRELDVTVVHAGHDPSFGRSRFCEIIDDHLARWGA